MENPIADYDAPWKEALERYFPEFLEFYFPHIHAAIDWQRPWEFLDKELQKIVREAETGRRYVDKLVKVWMNNGEETWLIVHVEIQSQYESAFPKRMFTYHVRLCDRYDLPIVSLAVLTDENPNWRPKRFGTSQLGCKLIFRFPTVKLLDYRSDWATLEQNLNPFAVVTMAHLQAQATRQAPRQRLEWKVRLVRELYDRGFSREDVLELFRFIDWLLALPEELNPEFDEQLIAIEEERQVQYVTSIERRGIAKGDLQRARACILEALEIRFGQIPQTIADTINQISDSEVLRTLHRQAIVIESIEAFQQHLAQLETGSN